MSLLDSLFNVLRGWPDEMSVIDESYKPNGVFTPLEGDIVSLVNNAGVAEIEAATSVSLNGLAVADLITALKDLPHMWLVVSGMAPGQTDGVFTGKAVCILGTYMFQTERFNQSDSYAPGDAVVVAAGLIRAQNHTAGEYQKFGEVIAHDSDNNTLTVVVGGAGA